MKKRGFTLVELIASIAIIGITMTAISPAFLLSIKLWKNNRTKINTMAYSQAIAEYYKMKGMENLKTIYNAASDSDKTDDSSITDYIYFDNDDNNSMKNEIDKANDITGSACFGKNAVENYNSCKAQNLSNKKYGAFLKIFKVLDTKNIDIFGIRIVVWNLANGNDSYSSRVIYLER